MGGSGGAAATYAAPFVTTTGTGSDSSGSFVVSTANGKLLTTADDLLSEFQGGTNPTNAGTAQYTNVTLTQGSVNSAKATVDVTGTTAPNYNRYYSLSRIWITVILRIWICSWKY